MTGTGATVVKVPRGNVTTGPTTPPVTDQGELYPWCLYRANTAYYSHDLVAVMDAALIPGYAGMDGDRRAVARIRCAIFEATIAQAEAITGFPETVLDAVQIAALTAPKTHPVPGLRLWASQVPLILTRTAYRPHTVTPAPVEVGPGVIEWIDPQGEFELLASLTRVGRCGLFSSR